MRQCKFCGWTPSGDGDYSSLRNHVMRRHPVQWAKLQTWIDMESGDYQSADDGRVLPTVHDRRERILSGSERLDDGCYRIRPAFGAE